jgi:hypothetical protein
VNGNRCDAPGCTAFSPPSCRWLYLVQPPEDSSVLAALGIGRAEPLTFCSMLCVAQYAYVQAVVEGSATGQEPSP